jgi:hypothetical protein
MRAEVAFGPRDGLCPLAALQKRAISAGYLGTSPDADACPRPLLPDGVASDAVFVDEESRIQEIELPARNLGTRITSDRVLRTWE